MKKLITILVVITLLGLGCRGLSQEEQQAVQRITLNYWTVFNDVAMLNTFAKEYQGTYPYIKINIRQVRYEEFDKLFVNALADDVAPDIVSMHSRWLRQYSPRLMEMPPGVEVTRIFLKGKFQPETVVEVQRNALPSNTTLKRNYITTVAEDVIVGGKAYGIPIAADTLALYFNKELLDQSGIALPPETWGEFSDIVRSGTRYDSDGDIIQSGVAMGTGDNIDNADDILMMLMMQNGVTVSQGGLVTFASGLKGSTPNHPSLEAMRFYTDFAQPTKDVYTWNPKMGNALDEFARGKTIFYLGYAYDRARIRARGPQLPLDVVKLPQLNPQLPGNVANYWVESVVKKTKNPNEAWDFVRFMTLPENVKRYTEATGQPSPLRAQIAEQQGNPDLEPFASQILQAKNWYVGRDYPAAQAAVKNLLRAYLQPYGENQRPNQRDAELVGLAQQVIQQTY
jgi:ABC-type glycerol-3-phosphate transport system substrate-binding protein